MLKIVTFIPVKTWINCKTNQAMAINTIPKSAQVTVWWAEATAFGSPPEVKYLIPAQTIKTSMVINAKPTVTEITLVNMLSISSNPAGGGPIASLLRWGWNRNLLEVKSQELSSHSG